MPVLKSKRLFHGLRRGQIHRLLRTIASIQAADAAQAQLVAIGKVPVYFAHPGGATANILVQLSATAEAALAART